jgi:RNA polymerase sigma-70 factor (ECF subfamily)
VSAEDQQLIDECLAGRTDAFGQLVVRYQDRLYNMLVKVLGSPDDARDTAQDAFVQAFQKLGTFHGNAAFYSWLFRIAMNSAISQRRRMKRFSHSLDAAREQHGIEPADSHPAAQPTHALELAERQQQVRRALAELAIEYRTVLVLKEMEGLKYEEIAEIVGCPIGTVRSRIHRARSELRQKLRLAQRKES